MSLRATMNGPAVGPAAALAALILIVGATAGPVAGALAAGIVLVAFVAAQRAARQRSRRQLALQLPEFAASLAAVLGAGRSLRQALERAATETPEPLASHLAVAVDDISLGARVEDALEQMAARLGERDLRILATAIMVQRVSGGNLARSLGELAGRLEERRRLEAEVATATAQARMTAWCVGLLPVVGAVIVEGVAPGMLARTLGHGVGLALAIASLTIQASGALLVARIVRSVR